MQRFLHPPILPVLDSTPPFSVLSGEVLPPPSYSNQNLTVMFGSPSLVLPSIPYLRAEILPPVSFAFGHLSMSKGNHVSQCLLPPWLPEPLHCGFFTACFTLGTACSKAGNAVVRSEL
jgi:hypothetical protein